MSKQKVQVILNPNARSGMGARAKDALAAALKGAGIDFELTETTRRGDALEFAAGMRANSRDVVVAAGGDGTVSEVLNGLARATPEGETIGPLAFCAIGTANDFADMSGAKRGAVALVERLITAHTRLVDVGRGTFSSPSEQVLRYFGNNVGMGFEAQVTVASLGVKRVTGPLRYLVAVFSALRHYQSPHTEVMWDDGTGKWQRRAYPTFMVSLGNSRRTGGMFFVTPDAVMDDGLLDLAIVPHKTKAQVLWMLPQTFSGAHRNDKSILFTRCVEVKVSSTRPVPVHLDGEVILPDVCEAHVEILPRRLEIIV